MSAIYINRCKFSLHLQLDRLCITLEYLHQFFQLYLILSPTLLAESELCIPTHTRCHNSRGKLDSQLEEMWIYQQICVDKFVCFHSFGKMPACVNKKPNCRHFFVDLHIFVDFAYFQKNIALPRANSK